VKLDSRDAFRFDHERLAAGEAVDECVQEWHKRRACRKRRPRRVQPAADEQDVALPHQPRLLIHSCEGGGVVPRSPSPSPVRRRNPIAPGDRNPGDTTQDRRSDRSRRPRLPEPPVHPARRQRPIRLADERRIGGRQHHAPPRCGLRALADYHLAAAADALALLEHRQGRCHKGPGARLCADLGRRRYAPCERAAVVEAQFVGVERHLSDQPPGRHRRERDRDARPGCSERPPHVAVAQPLRHGSGARARRAGHGDRHGTVRHSCRRDSAVRRRLPWRSEGENPDPARHTRLPPPNAQRSPLQIADHVDLAPGQRLRIHESRRLRDRRGHVQATRRDGRAVDRGEERVARSRARHPVGEHEPKPVRRPSMGDRGARHRFQPVEQRAPVHHDPRGKRVVQNHDEGRGLVGRAQPAPPRRDERPRRGEHDEGDQRGAQNEEQQVPQLQAAGALPLGLAEVAQRWEVRLGRRAALQQVQQGRDRRGGEPHQRQRMQEGHASSRNAVPKGMSVSTWW